jgi:hypothetical protein
MTNQSDQPSTYKVLRSHIGDSWDVEIIGPDGEITLKPGFSTESEAKNWVGAASGKGP